MNPSTQGWIKKYLTQQYVNEKKHIAQPNIVFYDLLKRTGFLYGISFSLVNNSTTSRVVFTQEEMTKVNLLDAFFNTFLNNFKSTAFEALPHIKNFYTTIQQTKSTSFLADILSKNDIASEVESILSTRVQNTTLTVKKDTASFFSYTLLYIDIITYEAFCEGYNYCKELYEVLEEVIISLCFKALQAKKVKTKYDLSILTLFQESIGTVANNAMAVQILIESVPIQIRSKEVFKKYIIDLCCLAMYDDRALETSEIKFLHQLCQKLAIPHSTVDEVVKEIEVFSNTNEVDIHLFQYSNPVKQLYKQTSTTVKTLIVRNKDRLLLELNESKELVLLLGQATLRDLDPIEKKKVRSQLLDICKTIPSLTIFLLPGGALLLPLLVKFIPKLLPSAFDDNRIEKK